MASYNKVILMGNLTRDPEVRYAQNGTPIVNFGLAVNRRFKDAEGNWIEEATFVDITMFGKRGEAFSRFHGKGKPAFIEGHLRLDQWEDKQSGGKRSKLYVVGENWEFVGGREGGGGGGGGGFEDAGASRGGGYESREGGGGGGDAGSPQRVQVDETPF